MELLNKKRALTATLANVSLSHLMVPSIHIQEFRPRSQVAVHKSPVTSLSKRLKTWQTY